MVLKGRRTRLVRCTMAVAASLIALGVAACASTSGSANGDGPSSSPAASATAAAVPGGTARVALPAGVRLHYIWPYTPPASDSEYNAEGFQMLMYRPLYMFGDNGSSVAVNYPLSLADAPAYADGGKTVTITMKGWKWSDGESVDASDVIFWINLTRAEPRRYFGYTPGLFPDNVASYQAAGPDTVVLRLKSAVSSLWFTYDQLAEITPMPAAWDVTAAGAAAGSGGCATDSAADKWARCAAVYRFLSAQARDARDYASSPIWAVVDGPWTLSRYAAAPSGPVASFVPNRAYSGSPKPELAAFTYYAYASDPAEYQALKSGQLDVGYVPPRDLAPVSGGQTLPAVSPLGSAYTLSADYTDGIQYLLVNFDNRTLGPAYRQLYVRQAIQELVDQEGMIASADRGYGYPTSGGVPAEPSSQWVPAIQHANGGQGPYAFSVANAVSLLASHGWKPVGGAATCAAPGTGSGECGAGVAKGTKLAMSVDYATGSTALQVELAMARSDMAQAGIRLTLVPRSLRSASGESAPCQPAQPSCDWDMLDLGGLSFNGPGFEPAGEALFATGAGSNAGGYSDPVMDSYLGLTRTSDSLATFQKYAAYVADQLPCIWLPNAYTVAATSSRLANVGYNPLATLLPEFWYFTG
jgi:peptide/nickel transport system substrate-binding protein